MGTLNPSMAAILPQQLDVFTTGMASSKKSLAGCRQRFNMRSILLSEFLGMPVILKFVLLCGYKNMVVRDMYALPSKYVAAFICSLLLKNILFGANQLLFVEKLFVLGDSESFSLFLHQQQESGF
jgi:hypothetical protein